MSKTITGLLAVAALAAAAQADSLRFTSGSVGTDYSSVALALQGPSNQVCRIERLSRTNQTWDSMGTVTLDFTGAGTFNTSLDEGRYGFFRAKTTNNTYYSTNAYGAVVGDLPSGYTMIGNMFGAANISAIIPEPLDGMEVWQYTTNYVINSYEVDQWTEDVTITQGEGFIVNTPSQTNRTPHFVVSGLFTTNAVSRTIPSGLSMQCSPLYQLITPSAWQVDELSTNRLGGYSGLPVTTSGSSPQCTLSRMKDTSANYWNYTLTTNNVWQLSSTNINVPLTLAEGFWLNKPSNAVWSLQVTIW